MGARKAPIPPRHIWIKLFVPSKMLRDATVCMFGQRRMGKTVLIEDLLFNLNMARVYAICGTSGSRDDFVKFMFETHAILAQRPEDGLDYLGKIYKRQEELKAQKVAPEMIEAVLVIDDKASHKKFMKSDLNGIVFSNGRHVKLMAIYAIQYIMQLNTEGRGNLDYAIFTRDVTVDNKIKAYKAFGGCCNKNDNVWETCFTAATMNDCVFIVDNTNRKARGPEGFYHWYRARFPMPEWTAGLNTQDYVNEHLKAEKIKKRAEKYQKQVEERAAQQTELLRQAKLRASGKLTGNIKGLGHSQQQQQQQQQQEPTVPKNIKPGTATAALIRINKLKKIADTAVATVTAAAANVVSKTLADTATKSSPSASTTKTTTSQKPTDGIKHVSLSSSHKKEKEKEIIEIGKKKSLSPPDSMPKKSTIPMSERRVDVKKKTIDDADNNNTNNHKKDKSKQKIESSGSSSKTKGSIKKKIIDENIEDAPPPPPPPPRKSSSVDTDKMQMISGSKSSSSSSNSSTGRSTKVSSSKKKTDTKDDIKIKDKKNKKIIQ